MMCSVTSPVDEALRTVALFRSLSAEDRARLAEVALVKAYDKGVTLFSEGDASDFLYTILAGRVRPSARATRWALWSRTRADPIRPRP